MMEAAPLEATISGSFRPIADTSTRATLERWTRSVGLVFC